MNIINYDVGLYIGHGTSEKDGSYDSGAVNGSIQEHNLATSIVENASKKLSDLGISVHVDEQNYLDNDSLGNTYSSKCIYSVHINSGGGVGSEILVPLNEKYLDTEINILSDMEKLGFKNRGIKSRDFVSEGWVQRLNGVAYGGTDYFGEIRNAWNQGVSLSIFEVGFIDTSDLALIQNNINAIADILVKNIAHLCGKDYNSTPAPTPVKPTAPTTPTGGNKPVYRVFVNEKQIGAYREVKNIIKEVEDALVNENWKVEIIKKV